MKKAEFQSFKSIRDQYEISIHTLRQWTEQGKIESIRTSANGKRLYNINSLQQHLGVQSHQEDTEKKSFVYARVSSSHQKEDLQRQIQDLSAAYPTYQVVQDIGSGLDFKRKGLQTLLEQVLKGMVKTIVVAYKDRLCRYGIELLELIFKRFGTQLVVYSKTDTIRSETTELADDLLAIANIFVARHNGRRVQENRRKRKAEQEKTDNQSSQSPPLPNHDPEGKTEKLARCSPVDLQPMCAGHKDQAVQSHQKRFKSCGTEQIGLSREQCMGFKSTLRRAR